MGSCNTAQKERSGKDLLMKKCVELEAAVAIGTGDDPTAIIVNAHELSEGDLVRFGVEALGTVSEVTAGQIYFVKSIVDANKFKISASPGGAAITFTHAFSAMTIELFKTVGGLRSKSLAFNSEAVDVSSHGSNLWKKIKDNAGMRSVSLSGSGIYSSDSTFKSIEVDAFDNKLQCFAFVDVEGGRVYAGCFKVTSVENGGDYDGESSFSISCESSGEIAIYQAVA